MSSDKYLENICIHSHFAEHILHLKMSVCLMGSPQHAVPGHAHISDYHLPVSLQSALFPSNFAEGTFNSENLTTICQDIVWSEFWKLLSSDLCEFTYVDGHKQMKNINL